MKLAQLSKIITVPQGATSFHTESHRVIFLIGNTGTFVEQDLTPEQTQQLNAFGALGTLGQPIED